MVRRSQDPKFGDYQANFAMPLGKQLGRPPREVAAEIVAQLHVDDFCEPPEVAGPGFINLRLKDDWLAERLAAAVADPRLGVPKVDTPRTYVVDYSAPNVAKPMHVGHIRSTVIGDALCRMLRFLGHAVISDNHIGDWGTQFGMILYGYRNFRDEAAYQKAPVEELARLYRLVRRLMDYHDGKARAARAAREAAPARGACGSSVPQRAQPPARPGRGPDEKARQESRQSAAPKATLAETRGEIESLEASLAAVGRRSDACRRWRPTMPTSARPCWPRRPSSTPATKRTCGCGASSCPTAATRSSGSTTGWASRSTTRSARASITIGSPPSSRT